MLFANSSLRYVLLGFSDFPQLRIYLFLVFCTMYFLTLLGNLIILSCIVYDKRLHSPMYYFLSNLSLVDMCFTSTTLPTLLSSLISNMRSIDFLSCFVQMFCFISFGNLENNLLAVMAYDRYVAICSPLQYTRVMRNSLCIALVFISWVVACAHALLYTLMVVTLDFPAVSRVNHFFCEISQVLSVSSSDTTINYILIFTEGAASVGTPFICIIVSYIKILLALLSLHSRDGRRKTFSTCSSHLTTVCLFYGTIVSVYFRPSSSSSGVGERAATIGYTLLTPMLNPFIYGLRNKAMKNAMDKMMK
ncbi:olfactory receptor 1361-like [Pelobates fuscus]|uniref:olfactory receptor 1361-like n=1 Tax=Pelobates fuscus TaxID=191477 RepID=UPI002FE465C9